MELATLIQNLFNRLLDYLSDNRITRTEFKTVTITDTPDYGIPIGNGKCKGVRLKLNVFKRNGADRVNVGTDNSFLIYYGDAQSQEVELIASVNDFNLIVTPNFEPSKFIPCTDLSQVFIRYKQLDDATPEAQVQVIIYH